jgi:hypothetical protein
MRLFRLNELNYLPNWVRGFVFVLQRQMCALKHPYLGYIFLIRIWTLNPNARRSWRFLIGRRQPCALGRNRVNNMMQWPLMAPTHQHHNTFNIYMEGWLGPPHGWGSMMMHVIRSWFQNMPYPFFTLCLHNMAYYAFLQATLQYAYIASVKSPWDSDLV